MDIVTEIAKTIYARAGESPEAPPKRGTETLVKKLLGPRSIKIVPHSQPEGEIAKVDHARAIMIRDGMSAARRNFVLARMLARSELQFDSGYFAMSVPDRLRLENEIAGWLCAPPVSFSAARARTRDNLRQLSFAFNMTETACALRIGELEPASGVAVTTPVLVHRKGPRFAWESDDTIRELATKKHPKSVRKAKIADEPGRVALLPLVAKTA